MAKTRTLYAGVSALVLAQAAIAGAQNTSTGTDVPDQSYNDEDYNSTGKRNDDYNKPVEFYNPPKGKYTKPHNANNIVLQKTPSSEAPQDIVVTGSAIRGIVPTGSSLTSITRTDIIATGATTTTELLRSIPQLASFNAIGTSTGKNQASFIDQPAIHGIAPGNDGALTLVLIDGLRLPGAGINQTYPDPSAIPPSALERVEVVADGASSIYGSDAIAGVVNFILRKNVNGIETNGKMGFGDGYRTYNANILMGKTWTSGSFLFDYEFSKNTNVNGEERKYYHQNSLSTLCSPANVTVGDVSYALSSTSASIGTNHCDNNKATDLYPKQHRHQFLVSANQKIGDSITLRARTLYTRHDVNSLQAISGTNVSSGGLSLAVDSGSFYDYVIGLGLPAGSQTVGYNPSGDFGETLTNKIRSETWSSDIGIDASIFGNWKGSVDVNYGRERDDIYLPGINQTLLTSLVASGEYNPYGVGAANDTALISEIGNYRTHYYSQQTVFEGLAKVDGTVFDLPGGAVKAAVGVDARRERFAASVDVGAAGTEPQTSTEGTRKSYSFYGELMLPLFSELNERGGLRKLEVSLSGRYDHYSDVGGTTNPKIGINWSPIKSLIFHGSFGKSFHAPSLADTGVAIDTRIIRFSDFTGSSVPGAYSIVIAGGGKLKSETAKTWSFGADLKPLILPGINISATFFDIDYKNVITIPSFDMLTQPDNPIYDQYRIYSPTAAQVLAATSGIRHDGLSYPDVTTLPTAIYDLRRQNLARQKYDGIDFDVSYGFRNGLGVFNVGMAGTWLLKFTEQYNYQASATNRLNTSNGINLKVRSHITWSNGPVDASVFVNFTNKYRNSSDDYRRVHSFTTVDLHGGWLLPLSGFAKDTQLTLDVNNLFDKDPPYYYDSGNGYYGFDPQNASALGRVVSIGVRKKF